MPDRYGYHGNEEERDIPVPHYTQGRQFPPLGHEDHGRDGRPSDDSGFGEQLESGRAPAGDQLDPARGDQLDPSLFPTTYSPYHLGDGPSGLPGIPLDNNFGDLIRDLLRQPNTNPIGLLQLQQEPQPDMPDHFAVTLSHPVTGAMEGEAILPRSQLFNFFSVVRNLRWVDRSALSAPTSTSTSVPALSSLSPVVEHSVVASDHLDFRAFPRETGRIRVLQPAESSAFFLRLNDADKSIQRISQQAFAVEYQLRAVGTTVIAFPPDHYPTVTFEGRHVWPEDNFNAWLKGILRFHFFRTHGRCSCGVTGVRPMQYWDVTAAGSPDFVRPSEMSRHLALQRHANILPPLHRLCQVLVRWNPRPPRNRA